MHHDTLVLGAGVAGLACASRLLLFRHNASAPGRLLVLEARDRIGGRIGSVNVRGCRLDTGPNWIHGTGTPSNLNPLTNILPHKRYREMKGTLMFQAAEEGHLDLNSPHSSTSDSSRGCAAIPIDIAKLLSSSVERAIEEVQDLATVLSPKEARVTSVLQALQDTPAFHKAYDVVPPRYHHTLSAMFQGIKNMEAAPLVAHTAEPRRPESKYGLGLLEYVVGDYGGLVALETIVQRIDWTRNPVVVETNRGTYTARELVCTFPLGVLKDRLTEDLFTPDLPADKIEAIKNLGFGTLDKIFAVYSRPWWDDEPFASIVQSGSTEDKVPDLFLGFTSAFDGISIGPYKTSSHDVYRLPVLNLHALTEQSALGAVVSCRTATMTEEMTDEQVSRLFHQTLWDWFGVEPPAAGSVHVTRWAQDPYSRGSYSHMITGLSFVLDRVSLQKPLVSQDGGAIRFAGEYRSYQYFGTVHGALIDGWRVAEAMSQ